MSMEDSRPILFIDNGGYNIKSIYFPRGVANGEEASFKCCVIPNCVGSASYAGRDIVGHQIHSLPHYHGFVVRRPVNNGFIVDGLLQAHIWEYLLEYFNIESEAEIHLWLTVPFASPKPVASLLNALLTQCFHFHSVTFISTSFLALIAYEEEQRQRRHMAINIDNEECEEINHSYIHNNNNNSNNGLHNRNKRARKTTPHAHSLLMKTEKSLQYKNDVANTEEYKLEKNLVEEQQQEQQGQVYNFEEEVQRSETMECEESLPPELSAHGCGVLVDVGFSATTIIPYIDYLPVYSSIVRIDVGGKVLTNRLKEILSYTQINLLEDGWMVNVIKEQCCLCVEEPRKALSLCAKSHSDYNGTQQVNINYEESTYKEDLDENNIAVTNRNTKAAKHEIVCSTQNKMFVEEVRYYLPTTTPLQPLGCVGEMEASVRLGFKVHKDKKSNTSEDKLSEIQFVKLQQERFLIPELLFSPSEIGLGNVGIIQGICEQIFYRGLLQQLPLLRALLLNNVHIYGGSALFDGFTTRVQL